MFSTQFFFFNLVLVKGANLTTLETEVLYLGWS